MPTDPKRKPIRLHLPLYAEPGRVFSITICTRHRRPVFARSVLARECIDLLGVTAREFRVGVHAYCLMPDHVHLLAGPEGDQSLIDFVGRWKWATDYACRRMTGSDKVWQRSFFDHALRDEESLEAVARYIVSNPVRAGLVEDWRDYPFVGSMTLVLR